jgi:DNA-binding phage protein
MTDTALLEKLIAESGLKLSYIAEQLGITRQGLYKKIKGLAQFTGPEIKTLCNLLNLRTWGRIRPVFFADNVSKSDNKAG